MYEDKTHEAGTIDAESEMKQAQDEAAVPSRGKTEMVAPEVNQEMVAELEGMGFASNRAIRALHFSGNASVEAAVAWLADHAEDADVDEELLIAKEPVKPKLTPEEAKAAAAELVRKAKERRLAEEAETEALRERERIRASKELVAAAREEEALRLKRNVEARRLEKLEEQRARDKIKAKLEQDRMERRAKLGLPLELTEEEKEAERKKQEAKEAAEKSKRLPVPAVAPVHASETMRLQLVQMKKSNEAQAAKVTVCFETLHKLCSNALKNPSEDKFRRVRLGNPALQQRLLEGSVPFLEAAGWVRDEEGMSVPGSSPGTEALLKAACAQLDGALKNPFFGVL